MTPHDIVQALAPAEAHAPLRFAAPDGPIAGGYHVTELKYAEITSIDCAARVTTSEHATLELLDGYGGPMMTVGTFRKLMRHAAEGVAGLERAPLRVEFGHGNTDLRVFHIHHVDPSKTDPTIHLTATRATCKPAQDAVRTSPPEDADKACYTQTAVATCC